MNKQLKTLGLAVFAAMTALATLDWWSRGNEKYAAGYEPFSGCPSIRMEGVWSMVTQDREKVTHSYKPNQGALCEFRVATADGLNEPITLGTNCYVGNQSPTLDTRELSASIIDSGITEQNSHDVNVNNSIQTRPFYELSQLKNHLA